MCGETFRSTRRREAGVTTDKPVPGVLVPSWFHFPVGLDVCQCDAMGAGQGLVPAAAPRLGCGRTPSFCALLPLRKCWQVNLASQA